MQNNICIIGVELNAQEVFISHKFTSRDIKFLCHSSTASSVRHNKRFTIEEIIKIVATRCQI